MTKSKQLLNSHAVFNPDEYRRPWGFLDVSEESQENSDSSADEDEIDEDAANNIGQCKRHHDCVRGYNHQGFGGHCKIQPGHGRRSKLHGDVIIGQCERHPECVRGLRHMGHGGMCKLKKQEHGSSRSTKSSDSRKREPRSYLTSKRDETPRVIAHALGVVRLRVELISSTRACLVNLCCIGL